MWDRTGMALSVLCMVHCAAMPIVLAFAPAVAETFFASPHAHSWLAGASLVVALGTFLPSYFQHRHAEAFALACAGLVLIGHAAVSGDDCREANTCCHQCVMKYECLLHEQPTDDGCKSVESKMNSLASDVGAPLCTKEASMITVNSTWHLWQTPIGGALLALAHLLNARFRRQCCAACSGIAAG